MTDEEKTIVAALNSRLAAKCACHCDADDNIVVDEMCLEHRMMIDDAVKAERERCAKIADAYNDPASDIAYGKDARAAASEIAFAIRLTH